MQPKIPVDLMITLDLRGLKASCYQPVSTFKKTPPRKLPNVPRDDDPWQVFLRREDGLQMAEGDWVLCATGETVRDALEAALAIKPGGGLKAACRALTDAVASLTGVIHASQG